MGNFRTSAFVALLALVFGFIGAGAWQAVFGHQQTREYLLENPEILRDLADSYDRKQARERLADVEQDVFVPFPGAVLGNPQGKVTLVEFTDYGCTYCRQSRDHVAALVKANPDLKVVIREWPIFDGSEQAARMALAAARQGKFTAFHDAMFELGPPSEQSVLKAAAAAGIDMAQANAFMASKEADFELAKNMGLARQLAFTGTPSWVVGDQVLQGAVGEEKLAEAIAEARGS
ncbi:DsbA family protein [Parerythrobacter lacustris]|uniref:DsbA family protein n=1 Tax=Parerythrobacter lacustris TaxID=2969984 RepID=A0ABT1XL17_9SPHN|nr:DsbA family protein [Parerythrobacter lacustris]MCR2832353.1 DsbA family protein [Parerythrobacter lacustris]